MTVVLEGKIEPSDGGKLTVGDDCTIKGEILTLEKWQLLVNIVVARY